MKDETRNRAALLTPHGAAAIAVVRLSGPDVRQFLQHHFTAGDGHKRETDKRGQEGFPEKLPDPLCSLGRCVHGSLRDSNRIIDDPVVVLSGSGCVADINLHGGRWVVHECLDLAQRAGFEIVDHLPDESPDLLQQEMLEALPHARTELAIRTLLQQPSLWTQFLKGLPTSAKPDLAVRVQNILDDRSLHWLLHPPKVAIIGIANVGKSTLANQLFGQQRSITADLPGTTRDWVGDWMSFDGLPILLMDTPGIRDSDDAIEQAAIFQSRREIERADLVILVLDPTQPREPQQSLRMAYPQAMVAINKSDLPATWDATDSGFVPIVALDGTGLDLLQKKIRARFITVDVSESHPHWWTPRQQEILRRALADPQALHELHINRKSQI